MSSKEKKYLCIDGFVMKKKDSSEFTSDEINDFLNDLIKLVESKNYSMSCNTMLKSDKDFNT